VEDDRGGLGQMVRSGPIVRVQGLNDEYAAQAAIGQGPEFVGSPDHAALS
jgi:hypothetical protein